MNLKPCPFCGGEVTMQYTGSSDWEVDCKTCPVETKFWVSAQKHGYGKGEADEAERRWNTRSSEADQRDAERLKEAISDAAYEWEKYVTEDNAPVSLVTYMERAFDAAMSAQSDKEESNG